MNATLGLLPLIGASPIIQPMVELIDRIAEATKAVGYSLSGAAVAIGLSAQASQKWKKGQISDGSLKAIATLTGYSYIWLREGIGPKRGDDLESRLGSAESRAVVPQKPSNGEVAIPQFDTGGMGGHGLVLQDQPGIIENWTVSREWAQANIPSCTSFSNLCLVTGFGDSMPDAFSPGDPIIVDLGIKSCTHDGIYFFRVGNEGFIKILQRIPGTGIMAISQNKNYQSWPIREDMDFEVFGKVLRAWKGKNY